MVVAITDGLVARIQFPPMQAPCSGARDDSPPPSGAQSTNRVQFCFLLTQLTVGLNTGGAPVRHETGNLQNPEDSPCRPSHFPIFDVPATFGGSRGPSVPFGQSAPQDRLKAPLHE